MRTQAIRITDARNWMLRWAAVAALMGMAAPAWGAPSNCAAAKKIYAENCAVCHMANGKGNAVLKTPDFTDPKWQASRKDSQLVDAITNGVKLTSMPPWKGQIKPAEINALVKCVIRGFGKKAASAHHSSKK